MIFYKIYKPILIFSVSIFLIYIFLRNKYFFIKYNGLLKKDIPNRIVIIYRNIFYFILIAYIFISIMGYFALPADIDYMAVRGSRQKIPYNLQEITVMQELLLFYQKYAHYFSIFLSLVLLFPIAIKLIYGRDILRKI